MSGPTALTALAAAGAVTLLTFVALAGIADVFGGARHRQVMRLTGARPGTAAGPSTGPLGVAAAGVQALGRHLWRHQRLVTVQDLREAGLEAAWITPRTVVATKLALGAGVGLALALLTPWVPAMAVGAPIGGLLGFVVPSLVIDGRRAARRARILAEEGRRGDAYGTRRTDRNSGFVLQWAEPNRPGRVDRNVPRHPSPSTEPLQFVAPVLPVDLPVGGKVKHWEFIGIRHPHER